MNNRKTFLAETFPLTWPYFLMSGIMVLFLSCGLVIFGHALSKDAEKMANQRISALSEEVYSRVTSYRKACDVLASSNAVLSFPNMYRGDANEVQGAITTLKQVLSNVVGIAKFPYTSVEIYYPAEEVMVSTKEVIQGASQCSFRMDIQAGTVLEDTIRDMRKDNAWTICYRDKSAWLIRQLTGIKNVTAFIIVEFSLAQLVPIEEGEGLVMVGNDSSLQYWSDGYADEKVTAEIREQVQKKHRFVYNNGQYVAYRCVFSLLRAEIMFAVSLKWMMANSAISLRVPFLLAAVCLVSLLIIFKVMYERVILPYHSLAEATWLDTETDHPKDVLTLARSNLLSLKSQQEAIKEENKLLIHLGVGDLLHQVYTLSREDGMGKAKRCLSLAGILSGQRYVLLALFALEQGAQMAGEEKAEKEETKPGAFVDGVIRETLLAGRVGAVVTLERYTVVIATCQDSDTEEKMNALVNSFTEICRKQCGISVAVTQPLFGKGPEELHHLVRRTMNDIHYLYFWQKPRISPEQIEDKEELISFLKAMRNLINRLDSQDYSGAEAMLVKILEDNIPRTAEEFQITKYRICGVIEMLLAAVSEESALNEETIRSFDFERKLYEADTLASFRGTAEQIFRQLIDIRQQCDSTEGAEKRMGKIKAYIEEHFTENDLTATSVAEHFNLSGSYVSREYKKLFHCNVLEYIQKLRVEQAKKLLLHYSVKESAQRSGFWDTQSLVRVFKKYEGITPGEYKKSQQ